MPSVPTGNAVRCLGGPAVRVEEERATSGKGMFDSPLQPSFLLVCSHGGRLQHSHSGVKWGRPLGERLAIRVG